MKKYVIVGFLLVGLLMVYSPARAEEETQVTVSAEEVVLASSPETEGFGLVVQNWHEDIQERFTFRIENRLELMQRHMERALWRLEQAAQEGDEKAEAKMEEARERYEKKLEKLQGLLEGADESVKEGVLENISKHQVVLEWVSAKVPESGQKGVDQALEKAQEHEEEMLEKFFTEEKASSFREVLDAKQEMIRERWQEQHQRPEGEEEGEEEVGGEVPTNAGGMQGAGGVMRQVKGMVDTKGPVYWWWQDIKSGLGL